MLVAMPRTTGVTVFWIYMFLKMDNPSKKEIKESMIKRMLLKIDPVLPDERLFLLLEFYVLCNAREGVQNARGDGH